jgi:hypothetical protein
MSEIRNLFIQHGEIANEIEHLKAQLEAVRESIKYHTMQEAGHKLVVDGVGTAQVTQASTSHSYDTKAIDALIAECLQIHDTSSLYIVKRLADARKTMTRAETLRITMKGVK